MISVEFVTNGCGPGWLKDCLRLYRDIPHWIPIAYFSDYREDFSWAPQYFIASKTVYKACSYQSATFQDYSIFDNSYIKELNEFIEDLTKNYSVALAFVDPGIVLRGDLVQILFGKVPLIVAHDCPRRSEIKDDLYGYGRVKPPEDYEEINFCSGECLTVWIQKKEELADLSSILKRYSERVSAQMTGAISTNRILYCPRHLNRKAAKIIPKSDEPLLCRHPLRI